MSEAVTSARRQHAVETLAGRLRYLAPQEGGEAGRQDRQAVNSVIQGSAADLLKCAMVGLWEELERWGCEIVLQIHDELIIDCADCGETKTAVIALLREGMCVRAKRRLLELYALNHGGQGAVVDVPLEQSVQVGKNLGMDQ